MSSVSSPTASSSTPEQDSASHVEAQQLVGGLPDKMESSRSRPTTPSTATLLSSSSVTSAPPTPGTTTLEGSILSPTGSQYASRRSSPISRGPRDGPATLVAQAFAPHVSVLSSPDCEELMRHKGLNGGLLELLRPFGEPIPGRVVTRDGTGVSRAWDDFGVRFTGIRDGLEPPRMNRARAESLGVQSTSSIPDEYRPARLRSGGDFVQIEQLVERQMDSQEPDFGGLALSANLSNDSPLFTLYEKKLLSGTVLSPHETFAHPVALVIAISSRSNSPIEELRNLYAESNTGSYRLPPWVNNEYLRYYVLVHDEDYDDIKKSTNLYEQMKRHFGLHCHLLRIRSKQCTGEDESSVRLPPNAWSSAAEDLTSMADVEDGETPEAGPLHVFEGDITAIRSFVREMVTQSIIPSMERLVAIWNDQVASRRRGLSGRFMSLSKRFTPFGSRSNSPSTTASGSNYDSSAGFYRADSQEALMRKLGDYAMMLRDYKLAQSTYEILCSDFKNDKAWRYYAGANEMAAITSLLLSGTRPPRLDAIDAFLENAYYSYFTRCSSLFHATRTIVLGAAFLKTHEASLNAAARWFSRLLDDRVLGPVAHALVLERIAACFAAAKPSPLSGVRARKAAFWHSLAARAWADLDRAQQAGRCLDAALEGYGECGGLGWEGIGVYLGQLEGALKGGARGRKVLDLLGDDDEGEEQQLVVEKVDQRPHRKSLSIAAIGTTFDPLGAAAVTPRSAVERGEGEDGFQ